MQSSLNLPEGSIEFIHGQGKAQHAIIWLHGLGATANDFPPIVPELNLAADKAIHFVFPQAPDRPITVNGGFVMPGWYDIKGMNLEDKQDEQGMSESRAMLDSIVDQLVDGGIASENIILAGFSQGGAVTYFTGVRSQRKFAGLLALSTYLPFEELTEEEHTGVNVQTPIFASHGVHDPVVPLNFGLESADSLKQLGYQLEWKTYPMEHQVSMQQILDIGAWINEVFE